MVQCLDVRVWPGQGHWTCHRSGHCTGYWKGHCTGHFSFPIYFRQLHYTPPPLHCFPILLQCCVERSWATLCYTATPLHKMKYIHLITPLNFLVKFDRNQSLRSVSGKHLRKCFKLVSTCPNVHSSDLPRAGAATTI